MRRDENWTIRWKGRSSLPDCWWDVWAKAAVDGAVGAALWTLTRTFSACRRCFLSSAVSPSLFRLLLFSSLSIFVMSRILSLPVLFDCHSTDATQSFCRQRLILAVSPRGNLFVSACLTCLTHLPQSKLVCPFRFHLPISYHYSQMESPTPISYASVAAHPSIPRYGRANGCPSR